jgi:hypothetical protein
MGSFEFSIMLWRLEANNGERANKKLAPYFCVNALLMCECIQKRSKYKIDMLLMLKEEIGNWKILYLCLKFIPKKSWYKSFF